VTALVVPLALAVLAAVAGPAPAVVEQIGSMDHAPLTEVSGIARSLAHRGVYWVLNDSGDEARIFAVDAAGKVLFPTSLADRYHGEAPVDGRRPWPGIRIRDATNVDWEDIALSQGRLYVADAGNNGNARRDLGIYVLDEPDPQSAQFAQALRFLPIRYPEQTDFPPSGTWYYDCEALFIADGKPYLLTRHRHPRRLLGFAEGTRLYRLDSAFTDRDNVLTLVDSHPGLRAVSAADLSPDGTKLAVLSYDLLWVFERPESGDRWLQAKARRLALDLGQTKQAEAVCWDDDATLRLANEQREVFRVPLGALEPVED